MTWPLHGANPHLLYKEVGLTKPKELLDYSVNTNPFGSPFHLKDYLEEVETAIKQYPEPNAPRIVELISNQENLLQSQILVGNGGSECVFLLANYFRGKNVCIVEPTFGEYRKACNAFNCHIESYVLKEESNWQLHHEDLVDYIARNDVLFICHPNNPTGIIYQQHELVKIIETAQEHGTVCVIDEAFYDFCKQPIAMTSYIKHYPNLIILRSLTKMYSIPGLRLGYIAANEKMIEQIAESQPPWSVNGLAQVIGEIVLKNQQFVEMTNSKLEKARGRLLRQLQELDYYVSNTTVNFFILRENGQKKDTNDLIAFLLKNGIVPRHTYNFIGLDGQYIRLTIKSDGENDKLIEALTSWKTRC
ncbi:threonine-phosphate decarboxylase CobD [Schinkia sp. CFF1]